jgi:hypothetical protein
MFYCDHKCETDLRFYTTKLRRNSDLFNSMSAWYWNPKTKRYTLSSPDWGFPCPVND